MSDLYPTKTRLALLQAVDDGSVTENYGNGIFPSRDLSLLDDGPGAYPRYRRVTARVRELRAVGWVELGEKVHDSYKAPRLWRLTDAGRAVLTGAADA